MQAGATAFRFIVMDPNIRDLDDQDENVRIAIKALGDMRNSAVRSDGLCIPLLSLQNLTGE